jgi:hypothetical protein
MERSGHEVEGADLRPRPIRASQGVHHTMSTRCQSRNGTCSSNPSEPVSDIDAAMAVDSLKVLDPKRPIREADIKDHERQVRLCRQATCFRTRRLAFPCGFNRR